MVCQHHPGKLASCIPVATPGAEPGRQLQPALLHPHLTYRVAAGTQLSHAPGLALREAWVSHSLRRALTHPVVAAGGKVCMSEITMAAQYGCTSRQEGLGAPFDLGMSLPQRGHSLAQADCPDSYICVWLRKKMIKKVSLEHNEVGLSNRECVGDLLVMPGACPCPLPRSSGQAHPLAVGEPVGSMACPPFMAVPCHPPFP